MENLQQKVINWVKTLKGWQCELAYRLLIRGNHFNKISSHFMRYKLLQYYSINNFSLVKLLNPRQ